jgi:hypothetical protein
VIRLSRLNSEAVEETRRAQRCEDEARRGESQALDEVASEQQRMVSLRADLVQQAESVGMLRATKDTLADDIQSLRGPLQTALQVRHGLCVRGLQLPLYSC